MLNTGWILRWVKIIVWKPFVATYPSDHHSYLEITTPYLADTQSHMKPRSNHYPQTGNISNIFWSFKELSKIPHISKSNSWLYLLLFVHQTYEYKFVQYTAMMTQTQVTLTHLFFNFLCNIWNSRGSERNYLQWFINYIAS